MARVIAGGHVFLVFKARFLGSGRSLVRRLVVASDTDRGKVIIIVLGETCNFNCLMGGTGESLMGGTGESLMAAVVNQTVEILRSTCAN